MAHVQSKPVAKASSSKAKAKAPAKTPKKGTSTRSAAKAPEDVDEGDAPQPKRGRQPGAKGYTDEETAALCDITENRLPHGAPGWEQVAADYNAMFPTCKRQGAHLKDKMRGLADVNPIPTGNKPMDIIHRRALDIKALIKASANSMSINDPDVPEPIEDEEGGEVVGTDEGEGSDEDGEEGLRSNAGDQSDEWDALSLMEPEPVAAQGSSALSVKIINPPTKATAVPKTPKAKADAVPASKTDTPSGSKPRPKPKSKAVAPFPLATVSTKAATLGSTSKEKKPVVIIDEDESSGPEFLDSDVKSGKHKAEDEGSMVVCKKPAAIISTPAKGTAACNQNSANTMAAKLIDNTDPAHMEKMAATRHEAHVSATMLLTKEGQVAKLQRDILNL
ncbi:hypothetical protein FRC07_013751 [Ceratobasidium sp. 392]|nr:hypothetical protein FRC07_013751 [Ceratobasidium sp. 392]